MEGDQIFFWLLPFIIKLKHFNRYLILLPFVLEPKNSKGQSVLPYRTRYLIYFYVQIMASKLHKLRSKIAEASEFASKHGCAYCKQVMEQNNKYVVEAVISTSASTFTIMTNWMQPCLFS